jgi:hypothetical protein
MAILNIKSLFLLMIVFLKKLKLIIQEGVW